MIVGEQLLKASRWALHLIDPKLRNDKNLQRAEVEAQHDRVHGEATLKPSDGPSITPSTELRKKPMIAVRVLHGGAQQLCNEVAYYYHYGFMRCNLAQDVHLQEGIYVYIDVETALGKIDRNKPEDQSYYDPSLIVIFKKLT